MNLTDITKQIRAFADQLESTQPTAPVDPYAELKAAHAAGKVIQASNSEGDWKDLDYPPLWNLAVGHYRIKPDAPPFQLPPPPPATQPFGNPATKLSPKMGKPRIPTTKRV